MIYNTKNAAPYQYKLTGTIKTGSNGVSDYTQLQNKPQINGVEIVGNKLAEDLLLQKLMRPVTNEEIEAMFK